MKKSLLTLVILFSFIIIHAQETIKIACVGNSITYGMGIADRDKNSYPSVLSQMLGEGYDVRNFGFSARTLLMKGDLPYMKEQMFKDALAFNPDIVIIKLGTNDSKPQNWKYGSEYKHDMETMVNSFKSLSSHPQIYLCFPAKAYALQWGINDSIIVKDIIPDIIDVAEECGTKVINLHTPTSNMPENFPDHIHPNEAGAKIIATEVYHAITRKD
ncbi:MAG: GDSL-type esterase/lipase family protein [Dysgonomonas sp.]|uniref:GDSL-type esterase/lipase family protein n=1 Tax=Dysgonomonas sp. TaxID=1891233 RepID=UPI0039E4DF02